MTTMMRMMLVTVAGYAIDPRRRRRKGTRMSTTTITSTTAMTVGREALKAAQPVVGSHVTPGHDPGSRLGGDPPTPARRLISTATTLQ